MTGELTRYKGVAGANLVAPSLKNRFTDSWFDPAFWRGRAKPVEKGGRGSAWFVDGEDDDLVLRHYCRGGLLGRFIRHKYLFTGEHAVRSFAELRLLDELYRKRFPVPEPLAAGYQRQGLIFYRAEIIIRRIPGAVPLASFQAVSDDDTWLAAGECVRRFHNAGVYHADLNCMNILAADRIYLIDFDRGRILPSAGNDGWKISNISRLERSFRKCFHSVNEHTRKQLWQAFLVGYETGAE